MTSPCPAATVCASHFGSGTPDRRIVYWGLQNNIFSPQQKIEYHILGHGADFSARYPYLENCGDPVIFHEEDWHGNGNF